MDCFKGYYQSYIKISALKMAKGQPEYNEQGVHEL